MKQNTGGNVVLKIDNPEVELSVILENPVENNKTGNIKKKSRKSRIP